jgi:hypothetical protein
MASLDGSVKSFDPGEAETQTRDETCETSLATLQHEQPRRRLDNGRPRGHGATQPFPLPIQSGEPGPLDCIADASRGAPSRAPSRACRSATDWRNCHFSARLSPRPLLPRRPGTGSLRGRLVPRPTRHAPSAPHAPVQQQLRRRLDTGLSRGLNVDPTQPTVPRARKPGPVIQRPVLVSAALEDVRTLNRMFCGKQPKTEANIIHQLYKQKKLG